MSAAGGLGRVLTVNAGSTSIKVSWFDAQYPDGRAGSLDEALAGAEQPDLVVHRVVHGGTRTEPEILDEAAVEQLRALTDLAPLHQPPALEAVARCRRRWPDATQVACFDTAFHAAMPEAARTYALPKRLRDKVRVYGFHGLSHAWATRQIASVLPDARRLLIAHLGGGQSLCAVLGGRSITTTMGFTPLDGLVMASRSGTIDPGALLWLGAHTDEDLQHVLDSESGLRGLAGTSDMREVLARADQSDPDAELALDVWLHRFLRQAGGCVAVLGGLDALVFTGGIGEHSAPIRSRVGHALNWLGVQIDPDREPGAEVSTDVSAAGASVRTLVVRSREDLQMMSEAAELLNGVSRSANRGDL